MLFFLIQFSSEREEGKAMACYINLETILYNGEFSAMLVLCK